MTNCPPPRDIPPERLPTMIYWATLHGTILRAESRNTDMVSIDDAVFAAPFSSNAIVGQNLYRFIAVRDVSCFYRTLAERVIRTGKTIQFAYRCDSPVMRREMSMRISPDNNLVRYESTLVREISREPKLPQQTSNAATFVALCCFCQKYRFPVNSETWKEIEELLIEKDLSTEFRFTHSICISCLPFALAGFGEIET